MVGRSYVIIGKRILVTECYQVGIQNERLLGENTPKTKKARGATQLRVLNVRETPRSSTEAKISLTFI